MKIKTENKELIILAIADFIILTVLCLSNNLLETNLSRICNNSLKGYFVLNAFTLIFAYIAYKVSNKLYLDKMSCLCFIGLPMGSIIRYNPEYPNAFDSNLHLLFAYGSMFIITIINIAILFRYKTHNPKLGRALEISYIIVFGICLYYFLEYGFVNSLCELIYLGFMIIEYILILMF